MDGGLKALVPAVQENDTAMEVLGDAVAQKAMRLGAELARDPAVQAAIAKRAGVADGEAEESETETLRKMVATLSAELEDLRNSRVDGVDGGRDDALAQSLETQQEALSADFGEDVDDVPSLASEPAADPIDDLFSRLNAGDFDRRRKAAPAPDDAGAGEDPELMEAILGAALAVASIVCLVVVTRKINPALTKRAAVLSAAALAGVLSKFSRKDDDDAY